MESVCSMLVSISPVAFGRTSVMARQVAGVSSPLKAAITGKQLPLYPQFGGVIKENASDSKAGSAPRGPRRARLPI